LGLFSAKTPYCQPWWKNPAYGPVNILEHAYHNLSFSFYGGGNRLGFSGVRGVRVRTTPQKWFTPPEAFGTAPKSFCTPANYTYFYLIVSYLIILTTKFVKLPILWSQVSPCRPRKQILLNFSLGLSGRCHHAPAKASSSPPPPSQIFIHLPPNENMKIHLWKTVSYDILAIPRIITLF
jgi:hypothetical protein